jgi:hypothetical protein
VAAHLERLHPVGRGELRAGPPDVLVDQPRAAEGAERDLQRGRDVEVHPGLPDVAGGERVAEHVGRGVKHRDLRLERAPVVLVAQEALGVRQARLAKQLLHRRAPGLVLDVVENQASGDAARLARLGDLVERVGKDGRGCQRRSLHRHGFGRCERAL